MFTCCLLLRFAGMFVSCHPSAARITTPYTMRLSMTFSFTSLPSFMVLILIICTSTSAWDVLMDTNELLRANAATFHFPEYAYKETSKNEIAYHEFEVACTQHPLCEKREGAPKKMCVRRCISFSCYQDIYAFDELEEGEIDVRLNSFKGCVIQRAGKTKRAHGDHKHLLQRLQLAEIWHELQWKFTSFASKVFS